jgi:hypothetical protein
MFRKVLISAIIATAVFAAGSAVYAQSGTNYGRDTAPVFELLSDNEETKTFSREYVVSGNANEGTQVTIDLYWFKAEDEKSIIATKKEIEASEKEGDWIFQQTEEFTVGASGIFMEPIALNLGLNKIVLFIKDIDGNTDEMILQLERFWEKQASEEVSGSTINKCVDDISNIVDLPE